MNQNFRWKALYTQTHLYYSLNISVILSAHAAIPQKSCRSYDLCIYWYSSHLVWRILELSIIYTAAYVWATYWTRNTGLVRVELANITKTLLHFQFAYMYSLKFTYLGTCHFIFEEKLLFFYPFSINTKSCISQHAYCRNKTTFPPKFTNENGAMMVCFTNNPPSPPHLVMNFTFFGGPHRPPQLCLCRARGCHFEEIESTV